MVLDDLRSVVDQVCGTDPAALPDGESIVELHRCLARLEAATTRAVASFDARREWDADGGPFGGGVAHWALPVAAAGRPAPGSAGPGAAPPAGDRACLAGR